MIDRVVIAVLDGVGVGALPDAADYGDVGADTLGHLSRAVGGIRLPNLAEAGLGTAGDFLGVDRLRPRGAAGRMAELSPGKDTLTGHWELAGLVTTDPIPTYPHGFPPDMLEPFLRRIQGEVLGNRVASGTEIIQEFGEEHLRTGRPIVYTSADSVFQVAAHGGVVLPERLYWMCEVARDLYRAPPYLVGRVIARPFTGERGAFRRTAGRRDYSLPPPGPTLLDDFAGAGLEVVAVGKVKDIFAGRGVTAYRPASGNDDILAAIIRAARELKRGLVMGNLVDFDMLYGHRNDVPGFAAALEEFDRRLPDLREAVLGSPRGGVLILTADHGCDPTHPGTDHTREYVPVLIEGTGITPGVDLGTRESFADLAATIADLVGLSGYRGHGTSFAAELGFT